MHNNLFPNVLRGKLWHTTSINRYQMIIESGSILSNPPIPNEERWYAQKGPDFYPYVRLIGGVSLFDFNSFDPDKYSEKYPSSSWSEFVPYRRAWGQSVWIGIERAALKENFICAKELLRRWKEEKAFKHIVMPMIEAACIGPIHVEAFSCVYISGKRIEGFIVKRHVSLRGSAAHTFTSLGYKKGLVVM